MAPPWTVLAALLYIPPCTSRVHIRSLERPGGYLTRRMFEAGDLRRRGARVGMVWADDRERMDSIVDDDIPLPEHRLDLYTITGVHGIKGEVKTHMLTDASVEEWDRTWIRHPRSGAAKEIEVESNRETILKGGRVENIMKIAGVNTRESALEYIGASIFVDGTEDFEVPSDEDEEEVDPGWPEMWDRIESTQDLIGFYAVEASTEQVIGKVESVESNGYQDLLVLRYLEENTKGKSGTFMVPFVEPLVPVIDCEDRMIVLTQMEGLY
ncbi:hypothetical protein AAMO2058_001127600 [Amorphochlora amoebiformis]